jgi:hypothetical protein
MIGSSRPVIYSMAMFQAIKVGPIENDEVWLCPVKNWVKGSGHREEERRGEEKL